MAQEVIRRLLAPIFEPQFHENSYGFIPGRNCHQAIERVLELHRQGYQVVLDADIQGFFDNLSHRVIMAAVAAEVADGNILSLVERFLTSGVMEDRVFKPTTIGTPQGGVVTPPTMLQRTLLGASLKRGWTDPIHDADLLLVDLDLLHQSPNDLPSRVPVRLL